MPTPPEITLRITTAVENCGFTFMLELAGSGQPPLSATGTFVPQLPADLSTELRWYMEQFLDERDDAALVRAKRIRESIKVCGKRLFQDVFQPNPECSAIWRRIAPRLSQTKIEIFESGEHGGLPWELLRDPTINAPVCLSAATFVRSHGAGSHGFRSPYRS